MSSRGKKRYYVAFSLLGAAISPLMVSLYSGFIASFHPSIEGYHEPSEGQKDSAKLLASYNSIDNPMPEWGRRDYRRAPCGYTDAEINELLADTADISGLPALQYQLVRLSGFISYNAFKPRRESDALMAHTTSFERGFLSACLNSIILRPFCREHAAATIQVVERSRAAEETKLRRERDHAADNVECLYLDGLNARRKKAAFLPPR